jgi:type II secretory pathway component PulF
MSDTTNDMLKEWTMQLSDIPEMIQWLINFFMWIAWTVAIIFIIIWAFKILFWSLEWDTKQWKDTIVMALWWFVLAALSWFIVDFIINNLTV